MDESSTEFLTVPGPILEQVIGQKRAVDIARLAASQRRFLFLVGDPGTGKSLLGRAVAELLTPSAECVVAALANPDDPGSPRIIRESPDVFAKRQKQAELEVRQEAFASNYFLGFVVIAALFLGVWLSARENSFAYLPSLILLALVVWQWKRKGKTNAKGYQSPKILHSNSGKTIPFIDATGCGDGALFGDVRHDPYQSGGNETPPHRLVEAGAIHKAHGGVLYIDEIGRLSAASQAALLSAIQDKALPITGRQSGSSGRMVCTDPVPCDFVLIAAGNLDDLKKLSPALRSRFLGYGYEVLMQSEISDTQENHLALAQFVAQEIRKDGRIPHFSKDAIQEVIAEARRRAAREGQLTARLRDLGGLVRVAGDLAIRSGKQLVGQEDVKEALSYARSIEAQQQDSNLPC